jgi:ubiquinone/menaquinone biosynthesis C-methylase UbiE
VKLNRLGRAAMNNGARAAVQRGVIAPTWARLGDIVEDGTVLEIGCGRGVGLALAKDMFGASSAIGIDLDEKMIAAAKRGGRGTLVVADVCAIPSRDGRFDAVFDFGAIHIVPDWEVALGEVHRVLRPGGRYFFEWVTAVPYRVFYRIGMHRFAGMRAPRASDVLATLERLGFEVVPSARRRALAATQLAGDLIGVAVKARSTT